MVNKVNKQEKVVKSINKSVRSSTRKLKPILRSIVGKKVDIAVRNLSFSDKRISNDVKKILQSAIANAENNHQLEVDSLYVSEAFVGKSLTMKRWRPRARGRVGKILKPFSNLTIIVSERKEAA